MVSLGKSQNEMTPEEFRKIILPEGRRLYALAFRYLNNRRKLKIWCRR
ncbi:MAG: hypothetical protein U5L72_18045 [Bacteroidales bacterium]|nr:hypothetical protein [Bacteroidales bacterium]